MSARFDGPDLDGTQTARSREAVSSITFGHQARQSRAGGLLQDQGAEKR